MNITITLTKSEANAIRQYLNEVDMPTNDSSVFSEVKQRLYHALRDPREAISDYVLKAESQLEQNEN